MGEILGIGIPHNPGLMGMDAAWSGILKRTLKRADVPENMKDPAAWPEQMQAEWNNDEATAGKYRETFVSNLRKLREALDAFNPDFVVVWGDDQYENFHEDVIPAFCVYAYEDIEVQPLLRRGTEPGQNPSNIWGEPADKSFTIPGAAQPAKYLASELLRRNFDVAYSYKPLHYHGLSHAFHRVPLYLDYDRKGWSYPVLPVAVNCYGSRVIANRGGSWPENEVDLDPPSPSPARCMALGAEIAKILQESPYRVALVASSSWSHAFLTKKHDFLYQDVVSDRRLYDELRAGNYQAWRNTSLAELEDAGEQEVLNWFCLAGAMEALGRKPDYIDIIQGYIYNSSWCFALYNP